MYGYPKIVDMFLLRGARTDIVNMGGDSLLHMAAQHGKYDILIKVRLGNILEEVSSPPTHTHIDKS